VSVTCPQGHLSDEPDFCSVCGARIGAPPMPAPADDPASATVAATASEPDGPAQPCPVCQTPRLGDAQFCEECGHDFLSPPADPPSARDDESEPTTPIDDERPTWHAVVEADRDQYHRTAPDDLVFPAGLEERVIVLDGDCIRIGRRSDARGTHPEIDLAGPPEDTGVSRVHAVLNRQADGSFAIVDMGSSNGTTLNDESTPLAEGTPRQLHHGDCIHLGAWTTITMLVDSEPD
jgi:hypothetical protein